MTFDEVLSELARRKGKGQWRLVADQAGIHYDTLARIARGDMEPTVKVFERIAAAIKALPEAGAMDALPDATPEPAKAA